jgi:hypothetical protein
MIRTEPHSSRAEVFQQKDWQLLFDLLPEIRRAKKFGKLVGAKQMADGNLSIPFWLEDEIVSRFYNAAYMLGIVLEFDWARWEDGIEILNSPGTDFYNLDLETLCKLLTFIVRCDKFCEGYLINCFETGQMAQIIEAVQAKVYA